MIFVSSLVASLLTLSASQSSDCAVRRNVLLGSAMYGGSDNPLALRAFHPAFEGGVPLLAGSHTVRQVVYNEGVRPTMLFGRELDPRESCMLFDKDFVLSPDMYDDKQQVYSNMPATRTRYSEWWRDMYHEDDNYQNVKSGLAYAAYKATVDPARRSSGVIRIVVIFARRPIVFNEESNFNPTGDCVEGNMPTLQDLSDAMAAHNAHLIWVPVTEEAENAKFTEIATLPEYPRFHAVTGFLKDHTLLRNKIIFAQGENAVLQTHIAVVFESGTSYEENKAVQNLYWAGANSEWHQGETWTIAYTRDMGPLCYIPSGTMSVVTPSEPYMQEIPYPPKETPLAHAIMSALIKYGGHPARRGGFVIYVLAETPPTFGDGSYTFSASCDGAKNPSWEQLKEKLIEYDARVVVIPRPDWDKIHQTDDRLVYLAGSYSDVALQVEYMFFNGTDEYTTHLLYQAGYDDPNRIWTWAYWGRPRQNEVIGSLSYTISWDRVDLETDYSGTCWIPRGFRDFFPVLGYTDIEQSTSTKPTGPSPLTFSILKTAASFPDRTPKVIVVVTDNDPVWGEYDNVDWLYTYCNNNYLPTQKEFERVLADLKAQVFVVGKGTNDAPKGWQGIAGVTTDKWVSDSTFYQVSFTLVEEMDDYDIHWAHQLHPASQQSSANIVATVGDWSNVWDNGACLIGPSFRSTAPKDLYYAAPPADGGAAFAMQSVENEYAGGQLGVEYGLYKMATEMNEGEALVLMVERPPAFTKDCKNADDCLGLTALCADDVVKALAAKSPEAVVFVGKQSFTQAWQDAITGVATVALDPTTSTASGTIDQQLRDFLCQENLNPSSSIVMGQKKLNPSLRTVMGFA